MPDLLEQLQQSIRELCQLGELAVARGFTDKPEAEKVLIDFRDFRDEFERLANAGIAPTNGEAFLLIGEINLLRDRLLALTKFPQSSGLPQ